MLLPLGQATPSIWHIPWFLTKSALGWGEGFLCDPLLPSKGVCAWGEGGGLRLREGA